MPRKELHEPYENYRYAALRHELAVRQIHVSRSVTSRASFIRLLRNWDKDRANQTRTSTGRSQDRTSCTRVVRTRRGCRFRLINVLLSPKFSGRWDDMEGNVEVNQLWLDVHAAFMAQNSMLDALHFQDALFVNVTPNVVLPHSAARLLQMWVEIVTMYRNAVALSKEAVTPNDKAHSFFDFCAGRLDLLYLHMAMVLEPKLYQFILSDKILVLEPSSRSKAKARIATASAASSGNTKAAPKATARKVAKPTSGKAKDVSVPARAPTRAAAATASARGAIVTARAAAAANSLNSCRVPAQNPEMEEASTRTCSKGKSAIQKTSHKADGKEKAASVEIGAGSGKEAKPKIPPLKQAQPASQSKGTAASEASQSKSFADEKKSMLSKTSPLGKRPREEEDTSIIEVPSVSNIVPHSGKRGHTTTTISTALAPRSRDVMLPPDEWDILESRLRKVNENIDRCHHGLASVEASVSDMYKQSLEDDLRFYFAIKQRLQEQLLVVMQSGY